MFEGSAGYLSDKNERSITDGTDLVYIFVWYNKQEERHVWFEDYRYKKQAFPVCYFYIAWYSFEGV